MELDRDFSEFIGSCVDHDVRLLIVGGYALAAHGHPRFTKDLDVPVADRCPCSAVTDPTKMPPELVERARRKADARIAATESSQTNR